MVCDAKEHCNFFRWHKDKPKALIPMKLRLTIRMQRRAVTSGVWYATRVESAQFDWRWRERPALALLAWEALVAIR